MLPPTMCFSWIEMPNSSFSFNWTIPIYSPKFLSHHVLMGKFLHLLAESSLLLQAYLLLELTCNLGIIIRLLNFSFTRLSASWKHVCFHYALTTRRVPGPQQCSGICWGNKGNNTYMPLLPLIIHTTLLLQRLKLINQVDLHFNPCHVVSKLNIFYFSSFSFFFKGGNYDLKQVAYPLWV